MATDRDGNRVKEEPFLASALRPVQEYDRERCGWLELDNGFFFFTDEQMWKLTARLFGLVSEGSDRD